jgi:hypothetical protein
VINVANPGGGAGEVQGTYTLPAGVRRVGVTGAGGCAAQGPQGFRCTFVAGASGGAVNVKVSVDPEAWRTAPLTGSVVVSTGGVVTSDGFAIVLPPGPPNPQIMTAVDNVNLEVHPTASPEFATLTVRVANALGAPAVGALDIVTPAPLDLVFYPTGCVGHHQLGAHRDRCELGTVQTGGETLLIFRLRVSPEARADAPMVGAVFGVLYPSAGNVLTAQASYRALLPSTDPRPAGETSAAGPAAPTPSGATPGGPTPSRVSAQQGGIAGGPLNPVWIVGSILGLFVLIGVVVVVSLRRRFQSDI